VTHLAAWLGLPVVAIFGPSDPVRWRPLGPHVETMRDMNVGKPCFELPNRDCKVPKCLLQIKVTDVMDTFLSLKNCQESAI
jgi:ADP-heptose:LPS heptosyltransferase